jgi:hypothetical protein
VFEGVVVAAEKFQIPDSGRSNISPMTDVMHITPTGRTVTTGIAAMPIAGDHRPSHRRRNHPTGPPDINRLRIGSKHHPADGGLTGILTDLFGGKHLAVGGFMNPPP